MLYIIEKVTRVLSAYDQWLARGQSRAEVILTVPPLVVVLGVMFAPSSFWDWYASAEIIPWIAPIIIIPLIPFYVATFFHTKSKGM